MTSRQINAVLEQLSVMDKPGGVNGFLMDTADVVNLYDTITISSQNHYVYSHIMCDSKSGDTYTGTGGRPVTFKINTSNETGDLLKSVYLVTKWPALDKSLYPNNSGSDLALLTYVWGLGYSCFQSVELTIGTQFRQRYTSRFMEISGEVRPPCPSMGAAVRELQATPGKRLREMVFKWDDVSWHNMEKLSSRPLVLYTWIDLFFTRTPGAALPCAALDSAGIELTFDMSPLADCVAVVPKDVNDWGVPSKSPLPPNLTYEHVEVDLLLGYVSLALDEGAYLLGTGRDIAVSQVFSVDGRGRDVAVPFPLNSDTLVVEGNSMKYPVSAVYFTIADANRGSLAPSNPALPDPSQQGLFNMTPYTGAGVRSLLGKVMSPTNLVSLDDGCQVIPPLSQPSGAFKAEFISPNGHGLRVFQREGIIDRISEPDRWGTVLFRLSPVVAGEAYQIKKISMQVGDFTVADSLGSTNLSVGFFSATADFDTSNPFRGLDALELSSPLNVTSGLLPSQVAEITFGAHEVRVSDREHLWGVFFLGGDTTLTHGSGATVQFTSADPLTVNILEVQRQFAQNFASSLQHETSYSSGGHRTAHASQVFNPAGNLYHHDSHGYFRLSPESGVDPVERDDTFERVDWFQSEAYGITPRGLPFDTSAIPGYAGAQLMPRIDYPVVNIENPHSVRTKYVYSFRDLYNELGDNAIAFVGATGVDENTPLLSLVAHDIDGGSGQQLYCPSLDTPTRTLVKPRAQATFLGVHDVSAEDHGVTHYSAAAVPVPTEGEGEGPGVKDHRPYWTNDPLALTQTLNGLTMSAFDVIPLSTFFQRRDGLQVAFLDVPEDRVPASVTFEISSIETLGLDMTPLPSFSLYAYVGETLLAQNTEISPPSINNVSDWVKVVEDMAMTPFSPGGANVYESNAPGTDPSSSPRVFLDAPLPPEVRDHLSSSGGVQAFMIYPSHAGSPLEYQVLETELSEIPTFSVDAAIDWSTYDAGDMGVSRDDEYVHQLHRVTADIKRYKADDGSGPWLPRNVYDFRQTDEDGNEIEPLNKFVIRLEGEEYLFNTPRHDGSYYRLIQSYENFHGPSIRKGVYSYNWGDPSKKLTPSFNAAGGALDLSGYTLKDFEFVANRPSTLENPLELQVWFEYHQVLSIAHGSVREKFSS